VAWLPIARNVKGRLRSGIEGITKPGWEKGKSLTIPRNPEHGGSVEIALVLVLGCHVGIISFGGIAPNLDGRGYRKV